MSIEKLPYQPTEEEMKKAEDMMYRKERRGSKERESELAKGEEVANEIQNKRGEEIMTDEQRKMSETREKMKWNEIAIAFGDYGRNIESIEFSPDALKEIESTRLAYDVRTRSGRPVKVIDDGLSSQGYFLIEKERGSGIYRFTKDTTLRNYPGSAAYESGRRLKEGEVWERGDDDKYNLAINNELDSLRLDKIRSYKDKGISQDSYSIYFDQPKNIIEKYEKMPLDLQKKFEWLLPALNAIKSIYKGKEKDILVNDEEHMSEEYLGRKKYRLGEIREKTESGLWIEREGSDGRHHELMRDSFLIPSIPNLRIAQEILKSKVFDDLFIPTQKEGEGDNLVIYGGEYKYDCGMVAKKGNFRFLLGEPRGGDEPIRDKDEIESAIIIAKEMNLGKEFMSKLERIKKLIDLGYERYIPIEYYHPEYYRPEEETPDEIYESRGYLVSPYQHDDSGKDPAEYPAVELYGRVFLQKEDIKARESKG